MLASVDFKFVLLAQEKTGSTALQEALRPHSQFSVTGTPRWKHISYRDYKAIFSDFFERNGCEVFGVVRDPLSYVESFYKFRRREKNRGEVTSTHGIPFEEFVTAWASKNPPAYAALRRPWVTYQTECKNIAPISYYRYESLEKLRCRFSELIGKDLVLKQANVSPSIELTYDRDLLLNLPKMREEYAFYNSLPFVA